MLRTILLSLMLALVAFVTAAPTASATCLDTNPDDNGVGTQGCNLPVASFANTCKVLVYGPLPGPLLPTCIPIVCVQECVPHIPPYDCVQDCDGPSTMSQPSPCLVTHDLPGDLSATCQVLVCEVGPVIEGGEYGHILSCESFLYCVTEPCPGSGRIEI